MTAQQSTATQLVRDIPRPAAESQAGTAPERAPLYFGRSERPLFGWLHRPLQVPTAGVGLVICNPFGNEAICAHRSIRQLADAVTGCGIPTLRFDYDGTGNSAGHDLEPDRVAAWIDSVALACNELRRATGVERVCLLGIRMGALFATLEAVRRSDVAGLIAVAPVVNGRAYVREQRLLSRAIDSRRDITRSTSEDVLETAGFLLSAQTRQSLADIDLNKMEAIPGGPVLILDRSEMPGAESWARRLNSLGARCEREIVPGYTEMMLDSHESIPPREIIDAAVRWLREIAGSEPRTQPGRATTTSRPRVTVPATTATDPGNTGAPIEESAGFFGDSMPLFGVVSARAREPRTAGQKGVILLNAGAVHHIGPNRMYVALSRQLANDGHVVLRMDIAGIGDSPPVEGEPENAVYSRYALSSVAAVIQYLRRDYGVQQVSAVGLCSGAYHAFKAAVAHLPLASVILINPLTFFWKEGMSLKYADHRIAADMARYRSNTLRLASWLKLLSGQVDLSELTQVLVRRADAVARKPLRGLARLLRAPLRNDLPTELLSAAHAGTELQFVFAENDPGLELLRDQAGAMVQRLCARHRMSIKVIDGADHTFTDLAARVTLVNWIVESLGSASALQPEPESV